MIYRYITTRYPQVCTPQGACTRPVPLQDVALRQQRSRSREIGRRHRLSLVGLGVWRRASPLQAATSSSNVSPDLLKSLDKKPPKKTSLLDRVHVAPMITPNGVGVGLSWEN